MKKNLIVTSVLALVASAGVIGYVASTPAVATAPLALADTFSVDAMHSSVVFRVKHQNVAYFYGRFNKVSGSFNIDATDLSKSTLEVSVDADSVDTNNAGREKHIKSGDFFSAKEFPAITFKSSGFKKTGEKTYDVTGDLEFRGVKKTITVPVELTGTGQGRGGPVAGIEAKFSIKRSEYGSTALLDGVSDQVDLIVALEGGKK